MRQPTEESFRKDISQHLLEIKHDEAEYRVLRVAQRDSFNMSFNIVTYPWYLVYSGDMGSYVFTRTRDMFDFFRYTSRQTLDDPLRINLGYWSEKLEATDKCDGHKAYDSARFKQFVNGWLDGLEADYEEDAEAFQSRKSYLSQELKRHVLSHADDNEWFARQALVNFEYRGRHPFRDSWETSFDEYTYRFVWCCYAIVWSIRQYDQAKSGNAP